MPLCNLVVLEFALPKEVFGFLDPLIVGIHRIVVVLYQSSSLLMLMKHASSDCLALSNLLCYFFAVLVSLSEQFPTELLLLLPCHF